MSDDVLTEVFPVQVSAIPALTAYQLETHTGDLATIGGKLAYQLRRTFGGNWFWTGSRLVTDSPQSEQSIAAVVAVLWREQSTAFHGLRSVGVDAQWQPSPQVLADYVARGLRVEVQGEIQRLLDSLTKNTVPAVTVARVCSVRGWVVQDQPAISVSVASRLLAKQDLKAFARRVASPAELVGLMVTDKVSGLKGEITAVTGTVATERERLWLLASKPQSRAYIQRADAQEPVLLVRCGRLAYEYVASALRIVVRTADYAKFGIDGKRATRELRLSPQRRAEMVNLLSGVFRQRAAIAQAPFSSHHSPQAFLRATDVSFVPALLVGQGQVVAHERLVFASLRKYGFYQNAGPVAAGEPVQIGVISAVPRDLAVAFIAQLRSELLLLGVTARFEALPLAGDARETQAKLIQHLRQRGNHLVLGFFPNSVVEGEGEDEAHWGGYHHFKSLTVGEGIPSQVVQESTMRNGEHALPNLVLGMLSKIGNIPYVLAEPLPYADVAVGIDIARRRKERLAGSMNVTAIARVYQSAGSLLHYVIHDAPLEGETIPAAVLRRLFPHDLFAGKRVLVHRDGYFRGREKQVLQEWAAQLGAVFHLVELIKSGTPRLYGQEAPTMGVRRPPRGSAFRLNDYEAFLVSSPPPFADMTPYPLHIRTEPPFGIEEALHSVLSLTLLHFGSLRTPRLPVTIHYSDEIAGLALQGIKPKDLEGTLPFWL